jgi:putative transposase
VYHALAPDPQQRQAHYRALFADALTPETLRLIRDTTNACRVLGNDKFKDQIENMLGRSVRPGQGGRPGKKAPATQTRSG